MRQIANTDLHGDCLRSTALRDNVHTPGIPHGKLKKACQPQKFINGQLSPQSMHGQLNMHQNKPIPTACHSDVHGVFLHVDDNRVVCEPVSISL